MNQDTYQPTDGYSAPVIHTDPEPAVRDLGKPPLTYQPHGGPAAATDEAERQAAFDSAFAWHGVELHPWTSSRDSLFAQHRLAIGAPSLDSCLGDLDAFTGDAHRILWLCSHTPADWSILRISPAALQNAVDAWADDHIPVRESLAASRLALDILTAARRNEHEAVAPTAKGHGDDLGN